MKTARPSHAEQMPAAAARRGPAIRLVVAVASLALLAAGCGGSSPARSTSQSPHSIIAAAFKFSSCMRTHGVTNFPDPAVFSGNGQQSVRIAVPVTAAGSPRFATAQKACQGIMPAGQNASPTQLAQQQHAREVDLVAFARCLRGHGLADFPDPTSQGQLTRQMVTSAGVDLHAPSVLTAAKACIGVTHGAITAADVAAAVNGTQ